MNVSTWKLRYERAVLHGITKDILGDNRAHADFDLMLSARFVDADWTWWLERLPCVVDAADFVRAHGPVQLLRSGRGSLWKGARALVEEIERRDRQEARETQRRRKGGA